MKSPLSGIGRRYTRTPCESTVPSGNALINPYPFQNVDRFHTNCMKQAPSRLLYCAHMKKEYLLGSVVILAILSWVVFHSVTKPSPVEAPGATDVTRLLGGSYIEHAAYYDIAANYASSTPLLTTAGQKADAAAVLLMKAFVSDTISQFKTDGKFDSLSAEDVTMMGFDRGRKETLQVNYLIASSPRTVSYIFTVYTDTLGAHGNTTFKTFVFETSTGTLLSLSDLFSRGSDYLATLSAISREKLPDAIGRGADTSTITEGTTPETKNFETFFFDNAYLTILFAPYQVASYAAGPQTLRIPTSDLRDILKSEYQ